MFVGVVVVVFAGAVVVVLVVGVLVPVVVFVSVVVALRFAFSKLIEISLQLNVATNSFSDELGTNLKFSILNPNLESFSISY